MAGRPRRGRRRRPRQHSSLSRLRIPVRPPETALRTASTTSGAWAKVFVTVQWDTTARRRPASLPTAWEAVMQHRTIGDLMTRPVVHVRTDATFKAVAATLAHDDVTAIPVVDDIGRPVGVVSEADLVRGVAQRPDPAARPGSRSRRTAPPVRTSRSRS